MIEDDNIAKARILFVDDEQNILSSLRRVMRSINIDCFFANSGHEALEILEQEQIDIVVSDMRMPVMTGAELLAKVAQEYPETIRMILSGYSDNDSVMSAINEGRIWGYVSKPWDDAQLLQTIEHAIFTQKIVAERALLRRTVDHFEKQMKTHFSGFVGSSIPMQLVYNVIERSAPSNASVFITGQSGTGKEVAARAIHDSSKRNGQEFLALNCAAIPSELMESEIFGHVKGAFSGAVTNRDGAATLADGGTLFLDELAEMDMNLQAKLLRFIQTGEFQKVGSSKIEKVDIRFVCATNREPFEAIKEKKLREDLFYRLNVVSIDMPSLDERGDDKLLLARHFLDAISQKEDKMVVGFSSEAEQLILEHHWPGNVRELENGVYSAVVMAQGPLIGAEEMKMVLAANYKSQNTDETTLDVVDENAMQNENTIREAAVSLDLSSDNVSILPLHEIEKVAIQKAVELCNDNVVKAAGMLEVSPSTLYRKMQNWKS